MRRREEAWRGEGGEGREREREGGTGCESSVKTQCESRRAGGQQQVEDGVRSGPERSG